MNTTRRQFLAQSGGLAGAVAIAPSWMWAAKSPAVQFPTEPRERVAVATYPFREFIVEWKPDDKSARTVPPAQRIELKNFAAHVVEKFGVHKVELWSSVFPSTEAKYVEELRAAVHAAGSAVIDIAVDETHGQYSPQAGDRAQAVAISKLWIDVGAALGSPSIRTHVDGEKDGKPDAKLAAETLKRVAEYAAQKNVVVHLENDNPVSEDPFFLVEVVDRVKSPWLRALPDFGNSLAAHGDEFDVRAMEAMFAHAYGICHVKDGEVDDNGKASHVDLARTFGILKKHNYRGYCSIEYDAPGDPYRPTAELIQKTIAYLSGRTPA